MFTQFFGNYLLNQKLVSTWQLTEALKLQKTTRLKLGVLAINAGYMNSQQVEEVHRAQARIDKRIGDIAVDMGYLTVEQVEELLSTQKTGHLLLGQALVDKGYMTTRQFESALNSYKEKNAITDSDFTDVQNQKIQNVIKNFYNFNSFKYAEIYTDYVSLLFKNIIRFIGDDFTPLEAQTVNDYQTSWFAYQNIKGKFNAFTAIEGNEISFINFASRYADDDFNDNNVYVKASIGEFLNLHNGLFTVNMSNDRQLELEMTPQSVDNRKNLRTSSVAFFIPICFPFGTINIIISSDNPIIL